MKKLKHFIIYILGVLLCLVITELLLSLAVKFIYSADNTFTKYVEKADK